MAPKVGVHAPQALPQFHILLPRAHKAIEHAVKPATSHEKEDLVRYLQAVVSTFERLESARRQHGPSRQKAFEYPCTQAASNKRRFCPQSHDPSVDYTAIWDLALMLAKHGKECLPECGCKSNSVILNLVDHSKKALKAIRATGSATPGPSLTQR